MNPSKLLHLYRDDILVWIGCNKEECIHNLACSICRNSLNYEADYRIVYATLDRCRKMLFPDGQNYDHRKLRVVKRIIRPFCTESY